MITGLSGNYLRFKKILRASACSEISEGEIKLSAVGENISTTSLIKI